MGLAIGRFEIFGFERFGIDFQQFFDLLDRLRRHDPRDTFEMVLVELAKASFDLLQHALDCLGRTEGDSEHQLGVNVRQQCFRTHRVGHPFDFRENFVLGRSLEGRTHVSNTEVLASVAQVSFQDLADVHSARNTQGIENDVDRRAVLEERHVLDGQDPGNNTLVAVPPGHLVSDHQLTLLGDVDLNGHIRSGGQFIGG